METIATRPNATGAGSAERRSPWAPAAWAALAFAFFLASSPGFLVVNSVVRAFADVPHAFEAAEWSMVWGTLSLAGVLIAGRLALGQWLRVDRISITVAVPGIVLSAVVNVVLLQWATARFGVMEPDYIGWTVGLFAVLIGFAVAAFGVFIAPRDAVGWPLAGVLVGFALTAVTVASNVPGLSDGIEPDSWPLGIWLGLSGLYAAGVTIASVIKARPSRATPER